MRADIKAMHARAARHGREIGIGVSTHVTLAATFDEAKKERAQDRGRSRIRSGRKVSRCRIDRSPELVAERIRLYEEIGVTCLMLQFHPMRDGMERFARDVLPLIR